MIIHVAHQHKRASGSEIHYHRQGCRTVAFKDARRARSALLVPPLAISDSNRGNWFRTTSKRAREAKTHLKWKTKLRWRQRIDGFFCAFRFCLCPKKKERQNIDENIVYYPNTILETARACLINAWLAKTPHVCVCVRKRSASGVAAKNISHRQLFNHLFTFSRDVHRRRMRRLLRHGYDGSSGNKKELRT